MRLAKCIFVEQEQFPESVEGEVPLDIFLLVHDSRRERLLVGLSLEDLLLDGTCGDKPIDEACCEGRQREDTSKTSIYGHSFF